MTVLRLLMLLAPVALAVPAAIRASLFLRSARTEDRKPTYIEAGRR
jgi:hypothetical protein